MLPTPAIFPTESGALHVSQILYFLSRSRLSQATFLCGLVLTVTFLSVYVVTWLSFVSRRRSQEPVKIPPTVPYMIPFMGSAISFALNPARCISESRSVLSLSASRTWLANANGSTQRQSDSRAASCLRAEDIEQDALFLIQARECGQHMEVQNNHNYTECDNICPKDLVWDGSQGVPYVHPGHFWSLAKT